ncbi:DUF5970 family protein [Gracilibacillus boraciitolerans]|uniref:DUF5970 family protein n=1 Tax=Gracilibacillus boraciitolerans TaxID=307521 RepID=UPI000A014FFE|nr:DUF5970 family protein [Gracilibacillus boraciitolerans]
MKKSVELLYLFGIPLIFLFGIIVSNYYAFLLPVSTFGLFGLYMFLFSPFKKKYIRFLFLFVFLSGMISSIFLYLDL